MSDDLNKRLENSSHGGTPQTKPDERRQYLGSLRERVVLSITVAEMKVPQTLTTLKKVLPDYLHHDYQALINGKLDTDVTSAYIGALSHAGLPFTLVRDETAHTQADAFALLIVAKTAVNEPTIDIDTKYPQPKTAPEPEKKSLWDKLFH
ncbi:hypothetical protein IV38_GL000219 [Lactobacillus selangorensis]|uniref:DUF1694 domain-containing protein n=1 Tax=Lactobacillus selangorensis TaxID=81857 RepID=A0A0R2G991_9LACO|nr:YueI family protein [Lactobacillus selangorensis]KRN29336.1 hypothetical protein IV38_GL000219 [Lactobacillus selangorensis]KRN34135.1 hypothetical protein IV40_GL000450 [Lactobacillus selangorensis]